MHITSHFVFPIKPCCVVELISVTKAIIVMSPIVECRNATTDQTVPMYQSTKGSSLQSAGFWGVITRHAAARKSPRAPTLWSSRTARARADLLCDSGRRLHPEEADSLRLAPTRLSGIVRGINASLFEFEGTLPLFFFLDGHPYVWFFFNDKLAI